MTPIDYYHAQCQQGVISSDPNQLEALRSLQRVYSELVSEQKKRSSLLHFFTKKI